MLGIIIFCIAAASLLAILAFLGFKVYSAEQ